MTCDPRDFKQKPISSKDFVSCHRDQSKNMSLLVKLTDSKKRPASARVESLSEEATVREKRKNAKIVDNGQIIESDFTRKTRVEKTQTNTMC